MYLKKIVNPMWGKGKENSRTTGVQSNWFRLEQEDPGSREMFPGGEKKVKKKGVGRTW